MNNKSEYLLLEKNIQTIISNLNDLNTNITDLTKSFKNGLDGDNTNTDDLLKVSNDLKAIKEDLSNKDLPEIKKIAN